MHMDLPALPVLVVSDSEPEDVEDGPEAEEGFEERGTAVASVLRTPR